MVRQTDTILTMNRTSRPTSKGTTFRLDSELRERLDAYALKTRRSRNGAVNFIVRQFLDRLTQEKDEAE